MPVTVKEGTTIDDLADTLEEYGIIKDTTIFKIQSYVYDTKTIKPGTYIFNTSKSGEEIYEIIKEGPEEKKEDKKNQSE